MAQTKARAKLWAGINGATGAQVLTAGGTLGTGNIAFTANPSAGDYITVNSTVFTFTSTASTATNINIKGSLALTLAEAETVIEAHSIASNIVANVDVTNTDADLTFTFYPNAYVHTFASSTDGDNTTDTAYEAGDEAAIINTTKSQALLEWADASGTLTYLMLPDGTVNGQMIELYFVSVAETTDSVGVLGTFASGDNLLTLGATLVAGDTSVLYWSGGVWKEKVGQNSAFSHTNEVAL